jgi:hypothetical protein
VYGLSRSVLVADRSNRSRSHHGRQNGIRSHTRNLSPEVDSEFFSAWLTTDRKRPR